MSEQVSPLERDHSLCVVLPGGLEKNVTVHGSKPLMDLVVTLCASDRLNPSDYTVDILSSNKSSISFKPNSPIGSLEAEKIVLKPKGMEEKIKMPYMPEATVRLLINYNKSHKTVVRVNPKLPLNALLPVVCDKCELKVETTILLKDSQSEEPLDLTKTLSDHGIREVFARDTAAKDLTDSQHQPKTAETEVISSPSSTLQDLPKKEKKWKENKGFFSLFRRRKKKHEMEGAASAPVSPGLRKHVVVHMNSESISSSSTLPADKPKKRRAPQPPMTVSQSVLNDLSTCNLEGAQRSAGSTLRSTKRRAPPPPCANTLQELPAHTNVKEVMNSLNTLEELKESDESVNRSPSSSAHPLQPQLGSSTSQPSVAHRHQMADPYLPSFRGKDFCSARCTLAKVLMSSVSKAALVRHLKNSATFPKFQNGSSSMSMSPNCLGNVFSTEVQSVLKSNHPTENEWEDPALKRGLTTFKVIPPKKPESLNPELTPDVQDQCPISSEDRPERKAHEVGNNQTDNEEKPQFPNISESEAPAPSPGTSSQQIQVSDSSASPSLLDELSDQNCPSTPLSEVEDTTEEQREEEGYEVTSEVIPVCNDGEVTTEEHINSEGQKEFIHSSNADMEQCSTGTDEKEVEEQTLQEEEKEESTFPPPPPPVFFSDDTEIMESEREDTTSSSLPSSQIPSPTFNGQINEFSEALQDESTSPMSEQSLEKKSAAPSKFAQAVAIAVQRSRCGKGPQLSGGPHSLLPSPPRSTYQYGA
ncbi:protein cordon-bleu-like isoform X2 [Archocentrus centrarchus]|uniref:protein cordon-bleu-like isoform X2 n=1 Tax=Archocentrus centrarchus TaxID=63155 RepID=UPI0011EA0AB4|nr:protein cordon-bleu-like isoform X2 [Archocentrus centrarchus]